jgi:Ca2+-transporting ATPase
MAFLTLGISQLFHAFNVRSEKYSIFQLKANWYVIGAFIICGILTLGVVLIPAVSQLFSLAALDWSQWLIVLGLSLVPVLVIETVKIFVRQRDKK